MTSAETHGFAEIEWALSPARDGGLALSLGGCAVHGRYAPRADAQRFAESTALRARAQRSDFAVLIGTGLGYAIEPFAAQLEIPLVVYEPFPELARALAPFTDAPADAGASSQRVASPDAFERALPDVATRGARPFMVVHPGYGELCRFEARFVAHALRRVLVPDMELRLADAIVSPRTVDALRCLPLHPGLDSIAGRHTGELAFVVSPGPSLAACLPALAGRRGGIVVAALQALRPLRSAGVRVDCVVAPDPLTYEPFLASLDAEFGSLLAEVAAPPGLLERCAGRTLLFALRSRQLHQIACARSGIPVLDEPFLTVSEIAARLAAERGARDLVLVGMDFASEDPRYASRFRAAGESAEPQATNSHYFHGARYLAWRLPQMAASGIRLFRTRGGLRIPGASPVGPDEVGAIAARAVPDLPVVSALWSDEARAQRAAIVASVVREAATQGSDAARDPERSAAVASSDPRFAGFDPLYGRERGAALAELTRAIGVAR